MSEQDYRDLPYEEVARLWMESARKYTEAVESITLMSEVLRKRISLESE